MRAAEQAKHNKISISFKLNIFGLWEVVLNRRLMYACLFYSSLSNTIRPQKENRIVSRPLVKISSAILIFSCCELNSLGTSFSGSKFPALLLRRYRSVL